VRAGATGPGVVALLLALSLAAAAPGETRFHVKGRSLAAVQVDAGRTQGLKLGDRLRVVSGPVTIGEIEVVVLTERSASCRIVSVTRPVGVGDEVVPIPRGAKTAGPAAQTASSAAADPPAAVAGQPPAPRPSFAALAPRPALVPPTTAPSSGAPPPIVSPPRTVAPAPPAAEPPASDPPPAAAPAPTPASARSTAQPPAPAPAVKTPASAPANGRRFRVKYRSAASVYLDAGRADGLDVGSRLRVLSGSSGIAEIEVVYAAERSASCKVISESRPVHAGDEAVLIAAARPAQVDAATPPAPTPTVPAAPAVAPAVAQSAYQTRATPWARVRGSASFGYYRSWDQTESALDYQQRTARLDLGLDQIAGQPLSFTLRARSRQDVRARALSTRTPADERTDRLYELALRYQPPSDRVGFEVGRIGIYRFVGIGYLDGALARYRPKGGVQVGAFGGRVADIEGLGWNGTGSKYGAFVRLAPPGRYSTGGYDATLAYVRENADGEVSREYLSLESFFGGGARWSLTERAELDLNRGWRLDLTGMSYQLSNISLAGNLRLAPSSWVVVSYDGRRNYRYYQNRVVPEEVFDDLLHQGLRAALSVAKPGGFGASVGFGMSLKEQDPRHPELDVANAYSFNGGIRHANLLGSGLAFGIDGSGFTNGYADGGLISTRLGWRAAAGHTLDLSYGYSLYRVSETQQDRTTQWLRLVGRGQLTRRLYLLGDFEYDSGDDLKGPRIFLELGVVF
jgi:hypothetical protein